MKRTSFAVGLALLGLLLRLPAAGAETTDKSFGVVDLHVDLSYQVNYKDRSFARGSGQFIIDELKAGGVAGVLWPLYIPRDVSPDGPRSVDLEQSYSTMFGHLATSPVFDMPGCFSSQKIKTWFAFEGAAPLAGKPELVRSWVARGVRVFGLVHSYDNELATSSTDKLPRGGGLTAAGREIVERVHAEGGVVDVSHASVAATREVVELATRAGVPTIATHSNAHALSDHPRNLTDRQIRSIASTGGIVGINFHAPFLVRGRPPTIDDVTSHVMHMVDLVGAEHVAIGSDFEGGIRTPPGLESARDFPSLARALLDRGLSRSDVGKIFSRNAIRVLCRPPSKH